MQYRKDLHFYFRTRIMENEQLLHERGKQLGERHNTFDEKSRAL